MVLGQSSLMIAVKRPFWHVGLFFCQYKLPTPKWAIPSHACGDGATIAHPMMVLYLLDQSNVRTGTAI